MAIPTQVSLHVVTAAEWNELVTGINKCPPLLIATVNSLDGNNSIVLPTGEETDLDLDAGGGGGSVTVNGISVPVRNPWPLFLVLTTNNTVTFVHESGSQPTAAKRIWTPDGTNRSLTFGQNALLRYRVTSAGSRWVWMVKS